MSAPDRLDLARLFLRIAETGSLSAAGRALALPQPTVSRQLRMLEQALGARLVNRTTHSLSLTEAGEAFRDDARRLLDAWAAAAERSSAGASVPSGRLRVVAPVGFGHLGLGDLAIRFARDHPRVALEWLLTDAPIDLAERGADCLLRVGSIQDESLVVRELGSVRRVVVAAPAFGPVAEPAQLVTTAFAALRLYDGDGTLHLFRGGEPVAVPLRPRFACDSLPLLHRAVLGGLGAAVLPLWLVTSDLERGTLVRLCDGWEAAPLPFRLAWPAGRFRPARLSAFLAFMQREAPALLA